MRLTIRNSDGSVSLPTDTTFDEAMNKLAEYEELEEQRRLVKLPCKVGDTLFVIEGDDINEYEVIGFVIENHEIRVELWSMSAALTKKWISSDDFGKTVFFEIDEAEEVLSATDTNVGHKKGAENGSIN